MNGISHWSKQNDPMVVAYQKYGNRFNNLKYFTIEQILNHSFWSNDLPLFWKTKDSICTHQCNIC